MTEYKIIRSNRKSVSINVTKDGVIVRAPSFADEKEIEIIVAKHQAWIEKNLLKLEKAKKELQNTQPLSFDEIKQLCHEAMNYIPQRAAYYAPVIGVKYGKITIRNQKTKWGSCSGKGNLNFNCLLMLMPPEVIDGVVVHELCHIKEMNHSKKFYEEVLKAYPDYYKWNNWLKENGPAIMMRMTG
ncbi:MAG: M48 family metallopeptidase [Oscillospiraceae bacterium]|nr:M48 family metallopeptidase [Oscillospiraceae bacterium]